MSKTVDNIAWSNKKNYRYVGDVSRASTSTSMYVNVHDKRDNGTYASIGWVLAVREDKDALPCVRRYSCWVLAVRGDIFLPIIRTHFLACEDVAGGSQQSGEENIIFQGKKDAVACMRPWAWCVPTVSLSRTVIFR